MPGSTNNETREKLAELESEAFEITAGDINWQNVAKAEGHSVEYYDSGKRKEEWLEKFKDELDKKILEASQKVTNGNLTSGVRGGKKENREEWGAREWILEFRAEKDQFLKEGDRKARLNALVKEIRKLLPRVVSESINSRE